MNSIGLGHLAFGLVFGATILWFRALRHVQLPGNRSLFVAAWLAGVACGIMALVVGTGWLGGVPAVLAIIAGTFFPFSIAISRQRAAENVIRVGATLPDFEAPDENGEIFEASSLAGHPVLIKFFRGHW